MDETKNEIKIISNFGSMEEAKEFENDITNIAKAFDKDAKITAITRRVCDGCNKTLEAGDSFMSHDGLDFCVECQKK
jgi:hypothetical protein